MGMVVCVCMCVRIGEEQKSTLVSYTAVLLSTLNFKPRLRLLLIQGLGKAGCQQL